MRPGGKDRLSEMPKDKEAYRFEIGGGHWLFGKDAKAQEFLKGITSVKSYRRNSSVYFVKKDFYAPCPLQNNLRFLGKKIAANILKETADINNENVSTMKQWLLKSFGTTLCELFFWPFNNLYTAGLYEHIAPQDFYKTPVDALPTGYNEKFVYPEEGLDTIARKIAKECNIDYGKRVSKIDINTKKLYFEDGNIVFYDKLISTLPLNKMAEVTALDIDEERDPHTSVLVLNIGAVRGKQCPDSHWLYIPDSLSGFYRVGFYSNVDTSFLPASSHGHKDRVSIYIEKAYEGDKKPKEEELKLYKGSVAEELQKWGFIKDVEIIDSNWVDVAYTWSWPGSAWKQKALTALKDNDIYQLGRYGRWSFQGIIDFIKDGLFIHNNIADILSTEISII